MLYLICFYDEPLQNKRYYGQYFLYVLILVNQFKILSKTIGKHFMYNANGKTI